MKLHHLAGVLLLPALLAGCGSSNHDFTTVRQGAVSINFEDGAVLLHANDQPKAQIAANGDFSIAGKPVTLTEPQRELFKQYYGDAVSIRDEGIATGKAGAAMAGHAIGDVVSGLIHGNPDQIGPTIKARAGKVTAQATQICLAFGDLRTAQDAISSQVEAFRPYATITADDVQDCLKETSKATDSITAH